VGGSGSSCRSRSKIAEGEANEGSGNYIRHTNQGSRKT
jgi:hypothetical protein